VTAAPDTCDVAVIGAGILGLALAREVSARFPSARLVVLEKEPGVAAHQSSHNSGVIHAGIYYLPGSLKARLCTAGSVLMYQYCEQQSIPAQRVGKLIVATKESEIPALRNLMERGIANGVPQLQWVEQADIAEIEPHARGVAAIHSGATGIVDYSRVAASMAEELDRRGHFVATGCEVVGSAPTRGGIVVQHAHGELRARFAIFCAGLWSDRLAVAAGGPSDPRIVPFRGAYLRLRPERSHLVRGLIYPVPDLRLPFLGVHLTRTATGDVLIGPTALMAPARDAYSLRHMRARDILQSFAWPGTWRMMRKYWRAGATEILHAAAQRALIGAAAQYVDGLMPSDVETGWAGIRAQALSRDGTLVDDFVFTRTERALHVRNAPSPAATSSLAIAQSIADELVAERVLE
jgi:2-hydroxyglutarate dehydrogenase